MAEVKKDIASLIEVDSNIDELYGIAKEEASTAHTDTLKMLKKTDRQVERLNQQFNSLLSLHAEKAITTDQFQEKKLFTH